jgi:cytochrome c oxidase subunit 4
MSQTTISPRAYFVVFVVLIVLTAVTVAVAYLDLGPLNTVAALAIAAVKALLVLLYFMHLRYSGRLVWLFAAAGFVFLALLIGLMLGDVVSRGWLGA